MPSLKPEPVTLTPKQQKDWELTRSALLWNCPAFSHIFYTMMSTGKDMAIFTKDVPIAATDGTSLIINPDTFFNYTLYQRIFICAHEIMHCVYNHCGLMHQWVRRQKVSYPDGTSLEYSHELMNVALDLVINDLLVDSKVGEFHKDWLHDTSIATRMDSGLDAYRKLYKECKKGGKSGKGSGMPGGKGFDQHLAPGSSKGQDAASAAAQRNEQEWKGAVAAAAHAAKLQGKLPAGLERVFGEVLEPQVDWRERIAAMFARRLGSGRRDWHRPDRRLIVREIYAPGRAGFGTGDVVVGADTSGSIGPKELDMFFAEIAGLLEDVKPRRLFLMWCDAKVHRVDELEDASDLNTIRFKGAPGGGGTSFVPVFEKIDEMGIQPEALVYLTDGLGDFPAKAPSYPVIWGNIYPQSKYPWGDVVDVPKQA